MEGGSGIYRLELLGTFCLYGSGGERIDIASRKGMALVAMLATAARGERTRAWLQDRLWGSRQKPQGQQSLRRELGNLRRALPANDDMLIRADHDRIRLDLTRCSVDVLELMSGTMSPEKARRAGEFLEGFDIAGEDGFEDWLREQRRVLGEQAAAVGAMEEAIPPAPRTAAVERRLPAIAMLPVRVAANDPLLENAGERISDRLVDRLSRLRWLSVISPSTIVAMRSGVGDREAIAAAVGARYLLEATILKKESDAAVSVSLVETARWRTLLSRRIALPDAGSSVEINDAVRDLVAAIDSQVETAEQDRVLNRRPETLSIDELVWRARWHLDRLTKADAEIAQQLIDRVIEERPNSSDALIQAGFCKAWQIWAGRGSQPEMLELRRLALRAIAADKFDARGHLLVGMAETWLRQPERARLALEEAISLNPSLCQAYMQLASALYLSGDAAAALPVMETALRLNPQDTQIFTVLAERAMVHCMLGDFHLAVESAELSLLRKPAYWFAHLVKIAALVGLDRPSEARAALADLRRAKPDFSADFIDWLPFTDPAWQAFLHDAVAAADGGGASRF